MFYNKDYVIVHFIICDWDIVSDIYMLNNKMNAQGSSSLNIVLIFFSSLRAHEWNTDW